MENRRNILEEFRQDKSKDKYFKIRNILNMIFIVMVIVTIALYFIYPLPDGLPAFFCSCLTAIFTPESPVSGLRPGRPARYPLIPVYRRPDSL